MTMDGFPNSVDVMIIPVDEEITLKAWEYSDSPQLFHLTQMNRAYLKQWLGWLDHSRTLKDSEKFVADRMGEGGYGERYEDYLESKEIEKKKNDSTAPHQQIEGQGKLTSSSSSCAAVGVTAMAKSETRAANADSTTASSTSTSAAATTSGDGESGAPSQKKMTATFETQTETQDELPLSFAIIYRPRKKQQEGGGNSTRRTSTETETHQLTTTADVGEAAANEDTNIIIDPASGALLVGVMGFNTVRSSDEGNGQQQRTGVVGYWIGEAYQGKGLASRALKALLEYGFDHGQQGLRLDRVEIHVAVENFKSRALPTKLGFFLEEEIQRDAEWLYDHFVDHVIYSMSWRDWRKKY